MKILLAFRTRTLSTMAVVAVMALAGWSAASSSTAAQPRPGANEILTLFRYTMLALDTADKTGNYSVFRSLSAPGFQANSVEAIAASTKHLRARRIDLAEMAVRKPRFSAPPAVGPDGVLHMNGQLLAGQTLLTFNMGYMYVDGTWKLSALTLGYPTETAAAK